MNKHIVEKKEIETETFQKKVMEKIDWGDNVTENFEKSQKIKKIIVKRALEYDAARNNDFILFIECLRDEFDIRVNKGKDNYHIVIPKEIIMKIPSPESYTRIRRKLNELNIGLPTNPNVIAARSKREKAMREYMKKKDIFNLKDQKPIQDTY